MREEKSQMSSEACWSGRRRAGGMRSVHGKGQSRVQDREKLLQRTLVRPTIQANRNHDPRMRRVNRLVLCASRIGRDRRARQGESEHDDVIEEGRDCAGRLALLGLDGRPHAGEVRGDLDEMDRVWLLTMDELC